ATVRGETVELGGVIPVLAGGTASGTTVNGDLTPNPDGVQRVFGTASGTIITHFGLEVVSAGGRTFGTTVHSSGEQDVLSGGTAIGTTLSEAFTPQAGRTGGMASATTIGSGGQQAVLRGGTAIGTTVNSGGVQLVSAGPAIGREIDSDAHHQISGATVRATTVNSGGLQEISSAGTAIGTTV